MITKLEVAADGITPLRFYHRAGVAIVDGAEFPDEKYTWTHPVEERESCSACMSGTIPLAIRKEKN